MINKYINFIKESNYTETSWTDTIGGKKVTITISDVENYLKDSTVIEIPVSDIKEMSIHKNKKDQATIDRAAASDLSFPIIISKKNGKYNMILDGHHRLQKAINTQEKFIKAKVLDLNTAPYEYQQMFR